MLSTPDKFLVLFLIVTNTVFASRSVEEAARAVGNDILADLLSSLHPSNAEEKTAQVGPEYRLPDHEPAVVEHTDAVLGAPVPVDALPQEDEHATNAPNNATATTVEEAKVDEDESGEEPDEPDSNHVLQLCQDILQNNETCDRLYSLFKDEKYYILTWEVTRRLFFERPFGLVLFLVWTGLLSVLNFGILFLCAFLKPLRSVLLTKIVSDLRRRYYFTNDSSEMRIIDQNTNTNTPKK